MGKQAKAILQAQLYLLPAPAAPVSSPPSPAFRALETTHLKPLTKLWPFSQQVREYFRIDPWPCPATSLDLKEPANFPNWNTHEQAIAALIHQALAVLDLSSEVSQFLVLISVLLLQVFELQDQQKFLLIDDHQAFVLILACRVMGEVMERGRRRCHSGWGKDGVPKTRQC